jgi:hypothetical protein
MNDSAMILRVGDVDLMNAIRHFEVHREGNDVVSADVVLDPASLEDEIVDWIRDVRILERQGAATAPHFTGLVSRVDIDPDGLHLRLASRALALREQQLGGGGMMNVTPPEMIVSLLRGGGLAADEMNIAGYTPGPIEAWEVTVPVDGLTLVAESAVGTVRLLPHSARPDLPVGLGPDETRDLFNGSGLWARAFVTAPTAYDAELAGSADIDLALAWLVARAHYSTARLPNGQLQPYERERGRIMAARRDVILVHGLQTHRYSLRSPNTAPRPRLSLDSQPDLYLPQLPTTLSPQEKEAVEAWRRAAQEANPIAQTAALWEAVEFMVAGRTAPEMFSVVELQALRARASYGLDERQRDRVLTILDQLNGASLLARLRHTATDDEVPVTEEEWAALGRVRRVRNRFSHGDSRDLPDAADLGVARAVVNRFIVHRVHKLANVRLPAQEPR